VRRGGETTLRKLAWFVAILLVISLAIAIACAASPDVKFVVVNFFVGVGGEIWIRISTGWSGLASTIGSSGTYFFAWTVGILVLGSITWITLLRYKKKIPLLNKATPAPAPPIMGQPTTVILQSSPTPTKSAKTEPAPTPEEKPTQEATA
jgi:hypothetical protein